MSTREDEEIEKFTEKPMFIIYPSVGSSWVIEIYDIYEELRGRIIVRNRNELIKSLEDSLEEDSPEIPFGEN